MKTLPPLLTTLFLAGFSQAAAANESSPWHWANGAAIATESIWRGQSLTDGKPALVGELKLAHSNGIYAGVWGGSLDLGEGTDTRMELDYFLGWAKRLGKWYVNTGYLYRYRPSDALALDFQEASVFASYDFGRLSAGAGSYHSWDYFQGGSSNYSYANVRVPLGRAGGFGFSATASAGRYHFSNRAIGDYSGFELRLLAGRGKWSYSVGYSDTGVDPATSGLLTRDRSGPTWRAQALVMF